MVSPLVMLVFILPWIGEEEDRLLKSVCISSSRMDISVAGWWSDCIAGASSDRRFAVSPNWHLEPVGAMCLVPHFEHTLFVAVRCWEECAPDRVFFKLGISPSVFSLQGIIIILCVLVILFFHKSKLLKYYLQLYTALKKFNFQTSCPLSLREACEDSRQSTHIYSITPDPEISISEKLYTSHNSNNDWNNPYKKS